MGEHYGSVFREHHVGPAWHVGDVKPIAESAPMEPEPEHHFGFRVLPRIRLMTSRRCSGFSTSLDLGGSVETVAPSGFNGVHHARRTGCGGDEWENAPLLMSEMAAAVLFGYGESIE